jgi:ADP-heptose:LPS heptosyltransferase
VKKIIFENPLAPGDILVSTCAIRDLHKAYPGEYLTDIRVPTGAEQIFENSPYITKIEDADKEAERIRLDYPDIHNSGWSGRPFVTAHTLELANRLGRPIPHTSLRPDIFLSAAELLWPNPVTREYGFDGPYWIINAGVKDDYTLKYYHRYQEVIDELQDEIQFVQVGQLEHNHPALLGVIDMRGKTNLRELFRLSHHAEGSVNAVSLQMVVMAALSKPCVVVSGGREPIRWQFTPDHRFLAVNGAIECAMYDGCWKSKKKNTGKDDHCLNLTKDQNPLCMEMIRPEDIVRAIRLYYIGGVLKRKESVRWNPIKA